MGDESAPVNDDDLVTDLFDFVQDVTRDKHGHLAAERANEVADAEDLVRVEADGGFVQDDDLGLGQERVRNTDALAEAFRELADEATGSPPHEVAVFHHLVDTGVHFTGFDIFEARAQA